MSRAEESPPDGRAQAGRVLGGPRVRRACALPADAAPPAASSRSSRTTRCCSGLAPTTPTGDGRGEGARRGHGARVRELAAGVAAARRPQDPGGLRRRRTPTRRAMTGGSTTASSSAPGARGCKVFLTLAPRDPQLGVASSRRRCPHLVGGYRDLGRSCMWSPTRACSGVRARGRPALPRPGPALLDLERAQPGALPLPAAAAHPPRDRGRGRQRYRELWWEGWKRHRRGATRRCASRCCSARRPRSARRWTPSTPPCAWTSAGARSGAG